MSKSLRNEQIFSGGWGCGRQYRGVTPVTRVTGKKEHSSLTPYASTFLLSFLLLMLQVLQVLQIG